MTRATLNLANVVIASGLPNPDGYQALYEAAAINVTYRSLRATPDTVNLTSGWGDSLEDVAAQLERNLLDLMASQGPLSLLKSYHYASIGRVMESPPPAAAGVPPGGGPSAAPSEGGSGGPSTTLLVAAIVPSVVVGVGGLVLVGVMLAQLQQARKRSLTGKVRGARTHAACGCVTAMGC